MRIATLTTLILSLSLAGGCAQMPLGKHTAKGPAPDEKGRIAAPPVIAEFPDVPIPAELKRQDDQSFVYEAPGVVIGVLTYSGYVTPSSAADFFKNSMPAQGWRFLNAFKDKENIDLFFIKEQRSCQITIRSSPLATRVVIKIGPSG